MFVSSDISFKIIEIWWRQGSRSSSLAPGRALVAKAVAASRCRRQGLAPQLVCRGGIAKVAGT